MTDQGPNQDGPLGAGEGEAETTPVSTRGPSVRLRDASSGARGQTGPRMDPANQSLAEALRFTYGLLKLAMLVLVVLFVFSGVKTVNEGERGIRVVLGKPSSFNLTPGFQPGLPYPLGEMIRIGEGSVEVKIARSFMPYGSGMETDDLAMAARADQFAADAMLKPGRSGSNITSDLGQYTTVNSH